MQFDEDEGSYDEGGRDFHPNRMGMKVKSQDKDKAASTVKEHGKRDSSSNLSASAKKLQQAGKLSASSSSLP